jgi:hypothetical protein
MCKNLPLDGPALAEEPENGRCPMSVKDDQRERKSAKKAEDSDNIKLDA